MVPQRFRRLLSGVMLAVSVAPSAALAQSQPDSGWFDPPTPGPADPVPAPYYEPPPAAEAAPAPPAEDIADSDPSALTTFRPALDPYGYWVADPKYGTVWVPHRAAVGEDFAPYVSRGHWALTADDDWIWVSDYPFGWAVFHYGRWVWIAGSGWAWVPGRTYANAWVVWRVPSADYAYVGWAPMPPSYVWFNGYATTLWYGPPVPYVFCSSSYVFDRHVHYHIVHDRHLVHRIASHTHVYPTPYRAPARPSRHVAANPRTRDAAPPPSAAPRGPRLSAARVPSEAVPAQRTAPPPAAARLAPRRIITTADVPSRRAPERVRVPERAERTPAPERVRTTPAPERAERVRPSSPEPRRAERAERAERSERRAEPAAPRPRASAPERVRVEPRRAEPARISPPSTSRGLAPVRGGRRH